MAEAANTSTPVSRNGKLINLNFDSIKGKPLENGVNGGGGNGAKFEISVYDN